MRPVKEKESSRQHVEGKERAEGHLSQQKRWPCALLEGRGGGRAPSKGKRRTRQGAEDGGHAGGKKRSFKASTCANPNLRCHRGGTVEHDKGGKKGPQPSVGDESPVNQGAECSAEKTRDSRYREPMGWVGENEENLRFHFRHYPSD